MFSREEKKWEEKKKKKKDGKYAGWKRKYFSSLYNFLVDKEERKQIYFHLFGIGDKSEGKGKIILETRQITQIIHKIYYLLQFNP